MAVSKRAAAAAEAEATAEAVAIAEAIAADGELLCDYCHVKMTVVKQMTLSDRLHEVRQCPEDPAHTKTLLVK